MTRTFPLSLTSLALVGMWSLGTTAALAQPRPSPAPATPAPPSPAAPQAPVLTPWWDHNRNFDFHMDWNFDDSGLSDSIREHVRAATESARQAMADTQVNLQNYRDGVKDYKKSAQRHHGEIRYRQAREAIDRERYEEALDILDEIIPSRDDQYSDAAMYWKAYSLGRLRRHADALAVLADMQKRFPDSRWLKDAKALEVETRQASGQAVSPDAQHDEELKLLALRGLMRTDPDRAMPMVERLMSGTNSIKLRENAMFVLSQSRSPKAREIIAAVAKAGNPDLQMRAIRYLGAMNGNAQVLSDVYRSTGDLAAKRAVIDSLARDKQGARALADLARVEKDPNLKKLIVSRLSNMSSPDATDYLLELLK